MEDRGLGWVGENRREVGVIIKGTMKDSLVELLSSLTAVVDTQTCRGHKIVYL